MQEHTNEPVTRSGKKPSRVKVKEGIYTRETRGGTRYEFIYQDSTGKTRWQTCATLKDAKEGRAAKVTALARGERVASSRATLAEYAATWLETQEGRLRPRTLQGYRDHLRLHIEPKLGRAQSSPRLQEHERI